MPGGERCLTHELWEDLGRQIHRYLAAVSIEDVLERRTRRGADADLEAAAHAVA
jgi:Rrf2 family iron-sulfur cluster assembly transcriptional regulator